MEYWGVTIGFQNKWQSWLAAAYGWRGGGDNDDSVRIGIEHQNRVISKHPNQKESHHDSKDWYWNESSNDSSGMTMKSIEWPEETAAAAAAEEASVEKLDSVWPALAGRRRW
jgi:hypothetical protein